MFVIGNFLSALATVINIVLGAYVWLIIGRVIISWVNADPYNPIVRFLYGATEPVLAPIRRRLPYLGGLDLSPMLLILAIIFLQQFLVPTLQRIAFSFS
ncbi:MAG: YggT family protein [Desulfobacteraceae bacterium]|nr:YggT family protein [Desulfobacteraceae bacterium]